MEKSRLRKSGRMGEEDWDLPPGPIASRESTVTECLFSLMPGMDRWAIYTKFGVKLFNG